MPIHHCLSISTNPVKVQTFILLPWVIELGSFLLPYLLFSIQPMYCCQIIFLNYNTDHINSLLKKLNFSLLSKSFLEVFKVIQSSVLNVPSCLISQHILLALHTRSNQIVVFSLDKSTAFLPCLSYSHNPFTWNAHY